MAILTGADYQRDIRLVRRSDKSPLDLTGFDLEFCVKAERGDAQALLVAQIGTGLVVTDPTSGVVTLDLTDDMTNAIGAGDRVWGLYRVDNGRRIALATGRMRVLVGV